LQGKVRCHSWVVEESAGPWNPTSREEWGTQLGKQVPHRAWRPVRNDKEWSGVARKLVVGVERGSGAEAWLRWWSFTGA